MGLLQGPRLMAWTQKSPIRGNHWVISFEKVSIKQPVLYHFQIQEALNKDSYRYGRNTPTLIFEI